MTRLRNHSMLSIAVGCSISVLSLGLAASANAASIISNGTVQLGIDDFGQLNVPGGTPSSGEGSTTVGLRFVPTNADGISPGCLCEGWGVADVGTKVRGFASNDSTTGGTSGLTGVSFTSTSTTATAVVRIGDTFQVTHSYTPTATPFLYQGVVTIENIGASEVSDLRYRRVMDWDVEPTAFNEFVTIQGTSAADGRLGSDNGFASVNPLTRPGEILFTGNAVDSGPTDHGAVFDFGFGTLAAGATETFTIFYGAAPNETDALAALDLFDPEIYSFGQPSGGSTTGEPNTFIFAAKGAGGTPIEPVPEPSSILGTLAFGALGAGWMLKRKQQQKVAGN